MPIRVQTAELKTIETRTVFPRSIGTCDPMTTIKEVLAAKGTMGAAFSRIDVWIQTQDAEKMGRYASVTAKMQAPIQLVWARADATFFRSASSSKVFW